MSSTNLNMIVRRLSTSNVTQQMVRPPVQIFGIEGRYATALYSAASKQKKLEVVEKELINYQNSLKTDIKFRDFIQNPTIKRQLKAEAMKIMSTKASLSPPTANFLQLLAENGRLNKTNQMINAFKTMMAGHRGEVTCEVTTAKELDSAQRTKLEGVLKSFIKANEKILLNVKIDPSILGGMVVSIGDRYVDMSVASKIKKYKELISTVV